MIDLRNAKDKLISKLGRGVPYIIEVKEIEYQNYIKLVDVIIVGNNVEIIPQ